MRPAWIPRGPRPIGGLIARTADGVRLNVEHRVGADFEVAVVLAHGFTNSMRTRHVRAIAEAMSGPAGVGVVSFDFRGHGRSGGQSTVGDAEVHDVQCAIDLARRLGYRRVVTCGFSMGGTCVIRHAAGERQSQPPDAAIAVSPLARWHYRDTKSMRRVLFAIETTMGRAVARYVMGTRISNARWDPEPRSPVDCIADVPVPLLIVHGDADQYFPVSHTQELTAAAPNAQVWLEPGMGHGEMAATSDLLTRLATWARRTALCVPTATGIGVDGGP